MKPRLGDNYRNVPASAAQPVADVFVVATDRASPATTEALAPQLTAEERIRGGRFVREEDRGTYAITRALVRVTLSKYAPTAPLEWQFVTNRHQCPRVHPSQAGSPPLTFNVSHTRGLVALAVTRGHRLGVDVEQIDRRVMEGVAERHFAPAEVRELRGIADADQAAAFFEYWTLKEAYIKARGMGLALPLDGFAFALHGSRPPTISFAEGFDDVPARWQFWQTWPTPGHRLALAIEREGADLPVTLTPVPLDALLP